ncbi:serine hydrolase [Leptolyngbya sp. FACHB-16]|uniref:serine hydrolase n=1 Tax=unclassified Leptolyngbya TaxID=2650499 RepID=UPI0016859401|nr:serine hydrolase [Leptolyngbya sp. FACHB-16]
MESGKPSRPPRRRRPGRRPPTSSSAPANENGRRSSQNGSGSSSSDLFRLPSASADSNRSDTPAPLVRRRSLRSPRPDSQLNLRRLLDEPTGRNGSSARRRPSEENGALTRLRPVQPVLSKKTSLPPTVIPIQARPVRPQSPAEAVISPPSPRRRRRRSQKPATPLLYITRLLIFGVGVGAIVGTILSIWTPAQSSFTAAGTVPGSAAASEAAKQPSDLGEGMFRLDGAPPSTVPAPVAARLKQPINELASAIQPLVTQSPDLKPGIFIVDLDTGNYVDINGDKAIPAASTIKVPILVAYLQDVDAGKARLDEAMTMKPTDITTGSGEFQYLPPGSSFSSLETITKMITISDNTATNMVLERVGGAQMLNQRFRTWGMTQTVIRNPLADLAGTNTTSARDLSLLLMAVTQADFLSLRSRDRLMEIMQGTVTDTLIPAGTGPNAVVAHKTGTIDSMVGDTGIVDLPNGKRYVITVLVQRPTDDGRAQELARQVARVAAEYFGKAAPAPGAASAPAAAPATPATMPATTAPQ